MNESRLAEIERRLENIRCHVTLGRESAWDLERRDYELAWLLSLVRDLEAERDEVLAPVEAMDGSLMGRLRASDDAFCLEAAKVIDSAHKLRERWREQVDSLVRERDAARAERDEYAKFIELRGLLDAFFLFRRGAL